jgi:15-cis-phytoene synthase
MSVVDPIRPDAVQRELERLAERVRAEGMPVPALRGQLIRPLLACSGAAMLDDTPAVRERFWNGVLALQLAHEASLVHDDAIDGAGERRGEPTVAARHGVAAALVLGDHLLTTAYRLAARTESLSFVTLFARAVERTVAGEVAQGRNAGKPLDRATYEETVLAKSGELMGCALALVPALLDRSDASEHFELGRRLGLVYQMLDDLLDYCPAAETGKPALGDYAATLWTWPLAELGVRDFSRPADEILAALHARGPDGRSVAERCLVHLRSEILALQAKLGERLGADAAAIGLLDRWLATGERAVARETERDRERRTRSPIAREALAARLAGGADHQAFMAHHSRSFRFASRFFNERDAQRVARVYAFCRRTDDLVDEPDPAGPEPSAMLDAWVALSRRAYDGGRTGIALLDQVMPEAADAGVPFEVVRDLVEGMRMDLGPVRYASLEELRIYTYRAASVVGLWICHLFGVRDPWLLQRAERLGHAMQLTNILRDVGEDLQRGRIYLPAGWMHAHGVTIEAIAELRGGTAPMPVEYRELLEALMSVAEADYRAALEAVPLLPKALRNPVAVAAHVYRGIHDAIRSGGYDNLRLRARTTLPKKLWLAGAAIGGLWKNPASSVATIELSPARAGYLRDAGAALLHTPGSGPDLSPIGIRDALYSSRPGGDGILRHR